MKAIAAALNPFQPPVVVDGRIVALANWVRLRDPRVAEVAFTVDDRFQQRGIGTRLLERLAARAADAVKLTPLPDRVRVEIGGQLFTEYVFGDGASRPYCYPILAPDGTRLTRDFPMNELPVYIRDGAVVRSVSGSPWIAPGCARVGGA